ncbi:hypothetical protein [Pseudonocardia asaccharolytica]|uniref:hypothetical protein n=1 Tax=Pseudonocardia asaccharolytica TaxID=54010 RepID=UPI0011BE9F38|nr:hypothetical protein [Pseudonocardia asaccharolytica]
MNRHLSARPDKTGRTRPGRTGLGKRDIGARTPVICHELCAVPRPLGRATPSRPDTMSVGGTLAPPSREW